MNSEEVSKVASLARLSLSEDELVTYGEQLTKILSYVDVLNEVDVEGVEPMPHAIDLRNVFREDQRQPSLNRTAALANAPKTDGSYFQVPQILEQKDA
ncbi:MAG: Asp-tRNA(Asn)/Glu-tRNA(Gln) amidotransferase subunit GatC [Planctomycetaceae bacterium]